MRSPIWTKKEDIILKRVYPLGNKKTICKALPNRSWEAIKIHASIIKVGMSRNPQITTNIKRLLEETHEAYYWMGFIAADGCFQGKYSRLTVTIVNKDLSHLKKYSLFIKSPISIKKNNCTVTSQDRYFAPKIMDKFDLRERKTYNPPKTIKWMNSNLAISFLIGFIDGDGFIKNKNRTSCKIKLHSSWIDILNEFANLIKFYTGLKTPYARINRSGYAEIDICEFEILKKLKIHSVIYKLPYMERKWNKIDENKIGYYEQSRQKIKICYSLHKKGYKYKEIAKKINISISRISKILSKIKDGKYIFNNSFEPLILESEV